MDQSINTDALISDIRQVIINKKANACPIAVRLAWHAAGTFDKTDGSGGSNGATMRFKPESTDPANAGLSIVQDLLLPVKKRNENVTFADLWTFAGCAAVEFAGGPKIPFNMGRIDKPDGSHCPPNGRLPDGAQGASHVRDVFYRMGFNDQEIVALLGAHTLGRCHRTRSGFDGPWTRNPLKFDNAYFRNLMYMEWQPKKWDGPLQFEDVLTGELMMLPADMALKTDPEFAKYAKAYADDQELFFKDFSHAFAKLISLGTPEACCPFKKQRKVPVDDRTRAGLELREAAMHGSLDVVKAIAPKANLEEQEKSSGRTALHKAAFWGHHATIDFLAREKKVSLDVQDQAGDTALHDAAKFGHYDVCKILLEQGASRTIKNMFGLTAEQVAKNHGKHDVVSLIQSCRL